MAARQRALNVPINGWTTASFARDIDGDGVIELALSETNSDAGTRQISLYELPSHGIVDASAALEQAWVEYRGYAEQPFAVGPPADLDGNGVLEVFGALSLSSPSGFAAAAWSLAAPGTMTRVFPIDDWLFRVADWGPFGLWTPKAADVNGDGSTDLVFSGNLPSGDGNSVRIYNGPFVKGEHVLTHADAVMEWDEEYPPGFIETVDLQGDGIIDLLLRRPGSDGAGELVVYFGPLVGSLDAATPDVVVTTARAPNGDGTLSFGAPRLVGDLDGDGHEDLVVMAGRESSTQPDAGAAYVFLGPWTAGEVRQDSDAHARISIDAPYSYLDELKGVGDVNGDGRDDLAVVAWGARPDLMPAGMFVPDAHDASAVGEYLPVQRAPGMLLVFTEFPAGELGPQDASVVLWGESSDANLGLGGIVAVDDVTGDGIDDLAVSTFTRGAQWTWWIVSPCEDYQP